MQKNEHYSELEAPSESCSVGHHPLITEHQTCEPSIKNGVNQGKHKNNATCADFIADRITELSKGLLNMKQWINAIIVELGNQHDVSKSDTSINKNDKTSKGFGASTFEVQSDMLIDRLITHVQSHVQAVGSSVEELISQTVVRLPRSTFELSHIISEAKKITSALEGLQDTVNLKKVNVAPSTKCYSFSIGLEECVQHLLELKNTQKKLKQCLSVLSKVTTVSNKMEEIRKNINRSSLHSFPDILAGLETNELKKFYKGLANTIILTQQVQHDLKDLQKIDPVYGEKHRIALVQYNQTLEKMLEHECLKHLIQHQTESAVELFQLLKLIGRKDAILANYARQVGSMFAERIRPILHQDDESATSLSVYSGNVVELIQDQFVSIISSCLKTEFDFLCELEEESAAYQLKVNSKDSPAPLNTSTSIRPDKSTASFCSYSSGYEGRKGIHSPVLMQFPTATSELQDKNVVIKAMEEIIHKIVEVSRILILPLLRNISSSKDLIDCYEGFKLISISSRVSEGSQSEDASGYHIGKRKVALPLLISGLRVRYAAQVSLQAVREFTAIFKDASLMEIFRDFTDMRLRVFLKDSALPFQAQGAYWHLLGDNSQISKLTEVFMEILYEVLRFFPEETILFCVKKWYVSLSDLLLGPTRTVFKPALLKRRDSSQTIMLQLYFTVKIVRPVILMLQRDTEGFLASSSARQLHPGTTSTLLDILTTELWKPLFTAAEASVVELRSFLRHIILEPVLAKTAGYTTLPIWGAKNRENEKAQRQLDQQSLDTSFKSSHVTPSELVRDLGESILEIPLTLEALRASSASLLGVQGSITQTEVEVSLSGPIHTIDELFVEETESWLDSIVHAAVDDFVKNKVLQVKIDFCHLEVGSSEITVLTQHNNRKNIDETSKQIIFVALQQLVSDLDYIKNVLSALSDDHFDNLEEVLVKLNTVLSTWTMPKTLELNTLKIYELVNKTAD